MSKLHDDGWVKVRPSKLFGKHWISLKYLQRYPSSKRAKDWHERLVKIYSSEHGYYWRGTGQGYTALPEESNTQSLSIALDRTGHCGPEKAIIFMADTITAGKYAEVDYSPIEARILTWSKRMEKENDYAL